MQYSAAAGGVPNKADLYKENKRLWEFAPQGAGNAYELMDGTEERFNWDLQARKKQRNNRE
jgi:hypothetical protein